MKAVLTTLGKFHSFDLARQLHARGALRAIYSGYPRFKLKAEGLPAGMIRTFPYVHTPYMAAGWRDRFGVGFLRQWEYWDRTSLDGFAARTLPDAEVFVGLSGCGLATGREAKRRGMKYVCDRGSTHIRHQDDVVRAEHDRWGLPFAGIDPRIIEREEAEYAIADLITVPSTCVRDTFVARGLPPQKVKVLSYGVDLERFRPVATPAEGRFDVLFVGGVSLRKGLPYLLGAFRALRHPHKRLRIAGSADAAVVERLRELGLLTDDVTMLGHVPQPELKALMSGSHVLVLPSVEEGLAMVMAQALACGCPVVASRATGAEDLFTDGVEGFIVAPGDTEALAERVQALADNPEQRARMGSAALARVRSIGGWSAYGENAIRLYERLN
ncbi:MAG: glycosyltransferase family 4 protein [Rhizobiales bacterium]|nr:glycosyltransferase family 4 protein [Rhizobacter sp.]